MYKLKYLHNSLDNQIYILVWRQLWISENTYGWKECQPDGIKFTDLEPTALLRQITFFAIITATKVIYLHYPTFRQKNNIYINKSKIELEKIKCKGIYWHIINNIQRTPKAIISWEKCIQ